MPFNTDPVEGLAYKPIRQESQQRHAKEDRYKNRRIKVGSGNYSRKKSPYRSSEKSKRNQKYVEKYTARTNTSRDRGENTERNPFDEGSEEKKNGKLLDIREHNRSTDNGDKISYHLSLHHRNANRKEVKYL